MGVSQRVFELEALKAKLRMLLTGCVVAVVTCFIKG